MPLASFPYRLAAVDLDDTLLGPDKRISAENAGALRQLTDRGVRIVLASGRRHENIIRFHEQLGLQGLILSCHGALVKDAETGEALHRHYVPAEIAAELVRGADTAGLSAVYYGDGGTYASRRNEFTALYEQRTETVLSDVADLREFDGVMPQKVLWVGEATRLSAIQPALAARYAGRLEAMVTDPEYLEFMAHGANKANGLAVAAAHYGIEPSQVLAFGDGTNDVAMLRWAGCGVAMDCGRESAKAAANWVSAPGSPETSLARAIAEVLRRSEP